MCLISARIELALMIIVHEYPLSMVDHIGFRKFCAALQSAFKLVSRNTIRKDILDTPSVSNYMSFDFFDIKFDHSSYSKNLYKHSQI